MKKLLIVLKHLSDGGAERVSSIWANELSKEFEVYVLIYLKRENEYELNDNVKRLNLVNSDEEYNSLSFLSKVKKIRTIINKINPDIIIPFLYNVNVAVSLANKNRNTIVFQTIRNNPWVSPSGKINRFVRNHFVKKEKYLLVQNNEQAEYFKSKRIKKYVVCNPVNSEIINIQKDNYSDLKRFISVGRLHDQKDYFLMIDIFDYLINKKKFFVKLDIYGDGPLKSNIENYIAEKNLTSYILLKGWKKNILEIEKDYDAFIFTSKFEGMPNALLEAMAIGLPVFSVNCKTGPSDLIINDYNGVLFNDRNPINIGDKIMKCNLKDLLETMGRNARMHILKKYSIEESIRELKNALLLKYF